MRTWTCLLLGVLFSGSLSAGDEFLRIKPQVDDTICLQVAVRNYAAGAQRDKTVQLVGVSHIGSPRYYKTLQTILDAADVVLFEGVDGDSTAFREATKQKSPERSALQANLAQALGLVFQLHYIDYERENFINSDVTSMQLMDLFDGKEIEESGPEAKAQMEQMLASMDQTSVSGQVAAQVLEFLELRPGLGKGMRWGMVRILGSATGNFVEYPGLPEHLQTMMKVLIESRNEIVMKDIHEQLDQLPAGATVAVFYGAAHMPDFEVRLEQELHAVFVSERWFTAFCGNLQTSGLNLLEKQSLRWFVGQQVQALKIISASSVKDEE
ncbi:hypothetical protein P3T73_16190 [Kiritimatiellota bacterium B12222]|nr:hypothetical protein P3T73_16190 [Kiritimatiellota bacterium B12222]